MKVSTHMGSHLRVGVGTSAGSQVLYKELELFDDVNLLLLET
jgi:hypothetical protein